MVRGVKAGGFELPSRIVVRPSAECFQFKLPRTDSIENIVSINCWSCSFISYASVKSNINVHVGLFVSHACPVFLGTCLCAETYFSERHFMQAYYCLSRRYAGYPSTNLKPSFLNRLSIDSSNPGFGIQRFYF